MKRIIATIFVLIFCISTVTSIVSCDCEHEYTVEASTPSSCSQQGTRTYTCIKCDASYIESFPMKEHEYSSKVETVATCTKKGKISYTCTQCKASYNESSPTIDHDYTDATCTTPKTCKTCGSTSGSALGHSYTNAKCSRCQDSIAASFSLPSIGSTYKYTFSSGKYMTCEINNIETTCTKSSSTSLTYKITITGKCTYNSIINTSRSMRISYKIYDSEDFVVKSGTIYSESITTGESFKETITLYDLEPGKSYKVQFLNTV